MSKGEGGVWGKGGRSHFHAVAASNASEGHRKKGARATGARRQASMPRHSVGGRALRTPVLRLTAPMLLRGAEADVVDGAVVAACFITLGLWARGHLPSAVTRLQLFVLCCENGILILNATV